MGDRFEPGDTVRITGVDPSHHTRVPRYARGSVGTILESHGRYPLADDRARGVDAEEQPVYTVIFDAAVLFGAGNHKVTIDLWEQYLIPWQEGST